MLLQLLFTEPRAFVLILFALVVSISVHEFAHAWAAFKLGDPTAKALGRVTLDPRAHLDPLGTILLIVAGFGWGRPVPVDPSFFKHPKRDSAIIAFAGPLSNFIMAISLSIILHLVNFDSVAWLGVFGYYTILYNLVLGFFNLLPIYPLDGYRVVAGFLSSGLYTQWMEIRKYGTFILLGLIITGSTGVILGPILNFSLNLLGIR